MSIAPQFYANQIRCSVCSHVISLSNAPLSKRRIEQHITACIFRINGMPARASTIIPSGCDWIVRVAAIDGVISASEGQYKFKNGPLTARTTRFVNLYSYLVDFIRIRAKAAKSSTTS